MVAFRNPVRRFKSETLAKKLARTGACLKADPSFPEPAPQSLPREPWLVALESLCRQAGRCEAIVCRARYETPIVSGPEWAVARVARQAGCQLQLSGDPSKHRELTLRPQNVTNLERGATISHPSEPTLSEVLRVHGFETRPGSVAGRKDLLFAGGLIFTNATVERIWLYLSENGYYTTPLPESMVERALRTKESA